MTKAQFRAIDLAMFSIITALVEVIMLWAFQKFPLEGYSVSFLILLGSIAVFRWNIYGIIPPLIGGAASLLFAYLTGTLVTTRLILSQLIGPLGLLTGLLWFKFYGKSKLDGKPDQMWAYFLTSFLSVEVVRTLCYIGDSNLLHILYTYFVLDLLNLVLGMVVMVIAVKQKGFVTDMNEYLINQNKAPDSAQIAKQRTDIEAMASINEKDEISDIALLDGGMLEQSELDELATLYRQKTVGKSAIEIEEEQRQKALEEFRAQKTNKKDHNGGSSDDNS